MHSTSSEEYSRQAMERHRILSTIQDGIDRVYEHQGHPREATIEKLWKDFGEGRYANAIDYKNKIEYDMLKNKASLDCGLGLNAVDYLLIKEGGLMEPMEVKKYNPSSANYFYLESRELFHTAKPAQFKNEPPTQDTEGHTNVKGVFDGIKPIEDYSAQVQKKLHFVEETLKKTASGIVEQVKSEYPEIPHNSINNTTTYNSSYSGQEDNRAVTFGKHLYQNQYASDSTDINKQPRAFDQSRQYTDSKTANFAQFKESDPQPDITANQYGKRYLKQIRNPTETDVLITTENYSQRNQPTTNVEYITQRSIAGSYQTQSSNEIDFKNSNRGFEVVEGFQPPPKPTDELIGIGSRVATNGQSLDRDTYSPSKITSQSLNNTMNNLFASPTDNNEISPQKPQNPVSSYRNTMNVLFDSRDSSTSNGFIKLLKFQGPAQFESINQPQGNTNTYQTEFIGTQRMEESNVLTPSQIEIDELSRNKPIMVEFSSIEQNIKNTDSVIVQKERFSELSYDSNYIRTIERQSDSNSINTTSRPPLSALQSQYSGGRYYNLSPVAIPGQSYSHYTTSIPSPIVDKVNLRSSQVKLSDSIKETPNVIIHENIELHMFDSSKQNSPAKDEIYRGSPHNLEPIDIHSGSIKSQSLQSRDSKIRNLNIGQSHNISGYQSRASQPNYNLNQADKEHSHVSLQCNDHCSQSYQSNNMPKNSRLAQEHSQLQSSFQKEGQVTAKFREYLEAPRDSAPIRSSKESLNSIDIYKLNKDDDFLLH